jgi:predicted DNA-binding transcriptional regulator AlpA
VRLDARDLLDSTEVAEVIGLANPKGVAVYRRRYRDFPAPAVQKGRCVLWLRTEIEAWAVERRRSRRGSPAD